MVTACVDGDVERDEPRPVLALARDLRVRVDACGAEDRVVSFDIRGVEHAKGLVAGDGSPSLAGTSAIVCAAPGGAPSIHRPPSP